jgi:hypothetical protein
MTCEDASSLEAMSVMPKAFPLEFRALRPVTNAAPC